MALEWSRCCAAPMRGSGTCTVLTGKLHTTITPQTSSHSAEYIYDLVVQNHGDDDEGIENHEGSVKITRCVAVIDLYLNSLSIL